MPGNASLQRWRLLRAGLIGVTGYAPPDFNERLPGQPRRLVVDPELGGEAAAEVLELAQ